MEHCDKDQKFQKSLGNKFGHLNFKKTEKKQILKYFQSCFESCVLLDRLLQLKEHEKTRKECHKIISRKKKNKNCQTT